MQHQQLVNQFVQLLGRRFVVAVARQPNEGAEEADALALGRLLAREGPAGCQVVLVLLLIFSRVGCRCAGSSNFFAQGSTHLEMYVLFLEMEIKRNINQSICNSIQNRFIRFPSIDLQKLNSAEYGKVWLGNLYIHT